VTKVGQAKEQKKHCHSYYLPGFAWRPVKNIHVSWTCRFTWCKSFRTAATMRCLWITCVQWH